jgi:hypothetical protein
LAQIQPQTSHTPKKLVLKHALLEAKTVAGSVKVKHKCKCQLDSRLGQGHQAKSWLEEQGIQKQPEVFYMSAATKR